METMKTMQHENLENLKTLKTMETMETKNMIRQSPNQILEIQIKSGGPDQILEDQALGG